MLAFSRCRPQTFEIIYSLRRFQAIEEIVLLRNMELPTLSGVVDAARMLRSISPPTPLFRSELLSRAVGADLWLKLETTSPIASFKWRGAIVATKRAMARGGISGLCTSSTGNHAQGVAFAARLFKQPADIFLPLGANAVKQRMIEALGASIHPGGRDIDEAKEAAKQFAKAHGRLFIDDGENFDLMEGAGTVGLEILESLTDIDLVLVPMGSGTLVTGVAAVAKAREPTIRIVAVQATGSPAMAESFHKKTAIERPINTIADGLVCRVPAARALAGLLKLVDDVILADDHEILVAVTALVEQAHVLAEPAGAAGIAGIRKLSKETVTGKRIVVVVTGANITTECLTSALQHTPAS